jgi:hypothetical protein
VDRDIISSLRTARSATDTLSVLRQSSLEARAERIREALNDPTWAAGPADLIATYPHHALASKDGVLMRVALKEDGDTISFGKVEVHEIPEQINDVGAEVMETAKVAVDHILGEDFEQATPLVASIANAMNFSGNLRAKLRTEVAKRSIQRDAWWHHIVAEQMGAEAKVEIPAPAEDVTESIRVLKETLINTATRVAVAINTLSDDKDVTPAVEAVAKDISTDIKYAIEALAGADLDDIPAAQGVYEGVATMAGHLMLGAEFLSDLAGNGNTEEQTA